MNSKKLLSLWGLKWNPFSPELPSEGLLATAKIESFAWSNHSPILALLRGATQRLMAATSK